MHRTSVLTSAHPETLSNGREDVKAPYEEKWHGRLMGDLGVFLSSLSFTDMHHEVGSVHVSLKFNVCGMTHGSHGCVRAVLTRWPAGAAQLHRDRGVALQAVGGRAV